MIAARGPLIQYEFSGHAVPDANSRRAKTAKIDPDTGEITDSRHDARRNRYRLRAVSARALPGYAVAACGRRLIDASRGVALVRHTATGTVSARNLRLCSSPWLCSVCASLLSERRAEELRGAAARWLAQGGRLLHVVYTVPHLRRDRLATLLDGFSAARARLKGHRAYKSLAARAGLIGDVYAVEITYGAQGWHPHAHQLVFLKPGSAISAEEFRLKLWPVWARSVELAELGTANAGAFHVEEVADLAGVADYISKGPGGTWGPAEELAKGPTKIARRGGLSPLALLQVVDGGPGGDVFGVTPERALSLWREYAEATRGRRALRWARKLRERLALQPEQTDEELIEVAEDGEIIGEVPPGDWERVTRAGWVPQLFEVAEVGGWPAVVQLLDYLRAHYLRAPPPPRVTA